MPPRSPLCPGFYCLFLIYLPRFRPHNDRVRLRLPILRLRNPRVMQITITAALVTVSILGEGAVEITSLHLVRQQITVQFLQDAQQTAAALSAALEQSDGPAQPGAPSSLQTTELFLERLNIPHGEYAILLSPSGRLLAHPVPSLVGGDWSQLRLNLSAGTQHVKLAQALSAQTDLLGTLPATPPGGAPSLLACHWSSGLGDFVCIVQPPGRVEARLRHVRSFLIRAAFLLRLALVILTWFIVGWVLDQYESRIADMAKTDSLTGLGNRHLLQEYLERRTQQPPVRGRAMAVIAIDLDGFKPINDTYGHAAGDQALEAVAQTLRRVTREPEATALRLGGDEFLVILNQVTLDEGIRVLERIERCFPITITLPSGDAVAVHTSCGYAFQDRGQSLRELLEESDQSLYSDKATRPDRGR